MGWISVSVTANNVTYLAQRQGSIWTIPCSIGLEVGDSFEADGVFYTVDAMQDLHGRGEVYVIDATEVKNDKPKTRRTKPKSGRSDVSMQSVDGHDNED